MEGYERVAAYIDLDALEENFSAMERNLKAGTQMAAVIKADGYGHGAVQLAKVLERRERLWGFAVATAEEALELRESGVRKPILILGYAFPAAYPELVCGDIRTTVFRLDTAQELSREAVRQNKTAYVHIKVDTGMSRIGFADTEESVEVLRQIAQLPGLCLEGLFTHFARADEADKTSAKRQLARYQAFAQKCRAAGVEFAIYHCSNSAGILDLPEANLNLVRAGITSYGLYPSDEVAKERVPLRPVMSLKSHIVHVKEIAPGTEVSYGGTYRAQETRRVATIPVGYADGYPRSLSNKGYVLIAGKRASILGRICMDQFMVDVTDLPEAVPGAEAVIFGKSGEAFLSVDTLAEISGRFNYEFVCDISARVPRIYLHGGDVAEIRGAGTR